MVFKCIGCGGDVIAAEGESVGTCQHCGITRPMPRLDTDEKANLFDRAVHYLRNNEYDKALAVYERILDLDNTDPEAHWALVLCRYGVEYVDDTKTGKKVITCNRTQRKSILADADYQAALAHATDYQKSLYEADAAEIERIQKAALAIIGQEAGFDVFICYKQTDRSGRPTKDSRRAQDIHDTLTKAGHKVFFSKITLEDKLGTEYEPYIFAALSSAKVMVAVGTSKENFESPWVRNEWSRFLTMAEEDHSKKLIPAYEDMDPYDMPEEFAMLQALNMESFTFAQDLARGVEKLLSGSAGGSSAAPSVARAGSPAEPLVKRARLMCEDGDFAKANELVEQALNLNPEDPEVYMVALMAEKRCRQEEALGGLRIADLSSSGNFRKAVRFGDAGVQTRAQGYDAAARADYEEDERAKAEAEARRAALEAEAEARRAALEAELNGTPLGAEAENRRLEGLRSRIAGLTTSESAAQQESRGYGAQIEQLRAQRKSLGLFAGAQKAEIDARIAPLERKQSEAEQRAGQLRSQAAAANAEMCGPVPKPAIRWRVLSVDLAASRALIITRGIVAQMPYHQPGGSATWAGCTLRQWLNSAFLDGLPTGLRSRTIEVTNPDNAGADTRDMVFLLDVSQAQTLFKDDGDRVARFNGNVGWWWLRSRGGRGHSAAYVGGGGLVHDDGNGVRDGGGGVRPALFINLEA